MDNKKKNKIFTIIVWCVFGMIVLPLLIGSLSIAIQNNTDLGFSLFGEDYWFVRPKID